MPLSLPIICGRPRADRHLATELPGDPQAGQRSADHQRQAFPAEVVDHPAVAKAPALIGQRAQPLPERNVVSALRYIAIGLRRDPNQRTGAVL